jgi:hypothetical protein
MVGTKFNMDTTFHPQTNGQIERINFVLEEIIRAFVAVNQEDWIDCLPIDKFTYNYVVNSSIQKIPFEVVYGKQPQSTLLLLKVKNSSALVFHNKWQINLAFI